MKDKISQEKLESYILTTEKALEVLEVLPPKNSHLRKAAEDFLLMASSYFKDSKYYFEKKDFVTSFACINYAHGFLDAGVRLGIFKGENNKIFAFGD